MNSRQGPATTPRRALVLNFRRLNLFALGAYGNEWTWTRAFDRLAARGVVFDQHFAAGTDPIKASSSWCADDPEVIHQLNKAGVYTICIRDQAALSPPTSWVDDHTADQVSRPASLLSVRRKCYDALDKLPDDVAALLWFDIDPTLPPWRPAQKWLKYYFDASEGEEEDPMEPWLGQLPSSLPDDEDDPYERLQTTYASVISTLDSGLARLLAGCRQRGFGTNALTILTSTLGEPLGENDIVGREARAIVEGIIHLPLILRFPDNAHAGRHISDLTQPNDIAATLADYFGLTRSTHSMSLLSAVCDDDHLSRDHLLIQSQLETAVRTKHHLLVLPQPAAVETARLYMKPEDRWEYNDLAGKNEADVERLINLSRRPGEIAPA